MLRIAQPPSRRTLQVIPTAEKGTKNMLTRTNNRKILFLTLIILSLLTDSCIPKRKTAKEYEELADKYFTAAKEKKAAKIMEKAVELDNKNPDLYVKLAEMYSYSLNTDKFKNYKKIELTYNKVMDLAHWYEPGLLSRANFFYSRSEYREALRDVDSLLSRYKTNTDAYLLKGKIYYEKKDTTNGNAVYRLALKNVPSKDLHQIYQDKAYYEFNLSLYNNAIADYLTVLKLVGGVRFYSYCELSWAYYCISKRDSSCYYNDLCDKKILHYKIDKEQLNRACENK